MAILASERLSGLPKMKRLNAKLIRRLNQKAKLRIAILVEDNPENKTTDTFQLLTTNRPKGEMEKREMLLSPKTLPRSLCNADSGRTFISISPLCLMPFIVRTPETLSLTLAAH